MADDSVSSQIAGYLPHTTLKIDDWVDAARSGLLDSLQRIDKETPDLMKFIQKHVTEVGSMDRQHIAQNTLRGFPSWRATREVASQPVLALSSPNGRVGFRRKYMTGRDDYLLHPPGDTMHTAVPLDYSSVFTHELMHQPGYQITGGSTMAGGASTNKLSTFMQHLGYSGDVQKNLTNLGKEFTPSDISMYGHSNMDEFMAEALTKHIYSPTAKTSKILAATRSTMRGEIPSGTVRALGLARGAITDTKSVARRAYRSEAVEKLSSSIARGVKMKLRLR